MRLSHRSRGEHVIFVRAPSGPSPSANSVGMRKERQLLALPDPPHGGVREERMTAEFIDSGDPGPSRRRPRPISVQDRHGAYLPYSKGLMAASMMAAGLGPEDAYRLAAEVGVRLQRMSAKRVTSGVLSTVAAQVIERERDAETARRYLAWRRAKRSPKPIIVLIGGATGVGKSTVATKLAARLDLPRVVATDAVRQIMRGLLSEDSAPEIHRSSFESTDADGPIPGFIWQAEAVTCGVIGLVERSVIEHRSVIVEGVHLLPGFLDDPRIKTLSDEAQLVQVLLALDDIELHRSHFVSRLENDHGRRPERYLRSLADIRAIQHYLIMMAIEHDVPVVDVASLDSAIHQVLDVVVDGVVEPAHQHVI